MAHWAIEASTTHTMLNGSDSTYWDEARRIWFRLGRPLSELDAWLGVPSSVFQEWLSHPQLDAYWDGQTPSAGQYAHLALPILTITGIWDGDQPGALEFYRQHMRYGTLEAQHRHYLIIGPWDHAGTLNPKPELGGLKFSAGSVLDFPALHARWYAWTMLGETPPEFLQNRVAYYVVGANEWRYADSLEAVTAHADPYYLHSNEHPTDAVHSGSLTPRAPTREVSDRYVYDPHDVEQGALETPNYVMLQPQSLVDQRALLENYRAQLIYQSALFKSPTEISGFFHLVAWISIDQPDTDFAVVVYAVDPDGQSVLLSSDVMRARYRESLYHPSLVHTRSPLRYDFERFTFVSYRVPRGGRLRLVLRALNSMYSEKNYNSDGEVARESMRDARTVTVTLFHDRAHPSVLWVPVGSRN
jgi:putative CocE/NonD family hydrolase